MKKYHIIISSFIVLLVGGIFLILTLFSHQLKFIQHFVVSYPLIAPLIIILLKMAAIIFPPLTGSIIGLSGISLFGWWQALIYDSIGTMGGAVVAFLIARKFRGRLVAWFIPLKKMEQLEKRLPENLSFWAFVLMRLPTEPVFDFLSYAAGLTRMSFWRYFFATILGSFPIKFLIFYFGGITFSKGVYLITILLVLLGIISVWFKKSKYYEYFLKAEQKGS